jgi:hypothetical protein
LSITARATGRGQKTETGAHRLPSFVGARQSSFHPPHHARQDHAGGFHPGQRVRVELESRPGDADGRIVYDCVPPDDVNRTLWLIPGQEAKDSMDVEGVFRWLWRPAGNGFPGYGEYRVEDAARRSR